MVIYIIGTLSNFNCFPNCKILKIVYFSKLNNFGNLMIFEIVKFGNFSEFSK